MSKHFYIVKDSCETVVYSAFTRAREHVKDHSGCDVWELWANGDSGALQVVQSGKPVVHEPEFQHDRKKEPFNLLRNARIATSTGKLPLNLRRHI